MAANPAQASSPPATERVTKRQIWSLTWPQFIMMLFQFFVGFTDVYVAGHISVYVQAALGLVTQSLFVFMVIGNAVANGGIAAMSQALGAKLPLRAERYVGLILKLGLALCIVAVLFSLGLRDQILDLMNVPESIREVTNKLWTLTMPLVPAQFFLFFTGSIFRSRKNVWIPLGTSILVCGINAAADFGFGLGMFGLPRFGETGLVIASFFSVLAGGLFNLFMLWKLKYISPRIFAPLRWEKKAIPYLLKVAIPSGGMQALWQLGHVVLLSIVSSLPVNNDISVAGVTAGMRVESLLFLPALAFNMTASVLVGHALGAGDRPEAKRLAIGIIVVATLIMSSVAALMFTVINSVVAEVTPDLGARQVAESYIKYNLLATPFSVISMTMGGVMVGAGATVYTFIIFSFSTWLVRLPLAWFLGHKMGMHVEGVFIAMFVSQATQALAAVFVLTRCDWYRFSSTAKRMTQGS